MFFTATTALRKRKYFSRLNDYWLALPTALLSSANSNVEKSTKDFAWGGLSSSK